VIASDPTRASVDISDFVSGSTISASDVVLAIVTMVIAWILSRFARRGVVGLLGRVQGISPDLQALAGRLTGYFVLLLGFGVALTFLGAPIQPMLSAAIIVAVVAALALRGVADNFAAGVVIQTRRPIQIGDRIEALNHHGVVREMNGRSVVIETADGRRVHLPNGKVLDNPLVNSSSSSARRTEIQVHSPGTDDIDATIDGIVAAAGQAPGVLADPAPVAVVRSIDHDNITMIVRVWHDPEPGAGAVAVSEVIRRIYAVEQRHGRAATVFTPPSSGPGAPPHP
jgi:small conductance mechanosensitive channel